MAEKAKKSLFHHLKRMLANDIGHSEPGEFNRSKIVFNYSVSYASCGLVFVPLFLFFGSVSGAVAIAISDLLILLTIPILKRTSSLVAGNWIVGVVYCLLGYLSVITGGYSAPSVTWLASLPVAATILCGRASGMMWLFLSGAQVLILFRLSMMGYTFRQDFTDVAMGLVSAFSAVSLPALLFVFCSIYEAYNQEVFKTIRLASITDDLTKLYNRRGFFTLADSQVKIIKRNNLSMALIFFDLDHLKQINDQFGHAEGDKALYHVARILKNVLRGSDIVARIGGDEFVAMLTSGSPGDVNLIVKRIQTQFEAYGHNAGLPYELSVSTGIFVGPVNQDDSLEKLIESADHAMYENKHKRSHSTVLK